LLHLCNWMWKSTRWEPGKSLLMLVLYGFRSNS